MGPELNIFQQVAQDVYPWAITAFIVAVGSAPIWGRIRERVNSRRQERTRRTGAAK